MSKRGTSLRIIGMVARRGTSSILLFINGLEKIAKKLSESCKIDGFGCVRSGRSYEQIQFFFWGKLGCSAKLAVLPSMLLECSGCTDQSATSPVGPPRAVLG